MTIARVFAAVLLMSSQGVFAQSCYSCAAPVYVAPAVTTSPVFYRAYYAPVTVTAYQPVAAYNTCAYTAVAAYQPATAYSAVTTYRPLLGIWTTRLVPYTTYQPVYTPTVAYAGYSPCTTCSPCGYYLATCPAPAANCATCAAPATSAGAPTPTYEQEVKKPAPGAEIKPIPQTDAQMNSIPAPALPDPRERTTSRPTYQSMRVALTALPVQASPARSDSGWQPLRD